MNVIPHVKLFYYSIMLCVQWAGMLLVICGLVTVGVNDLIHTKVTYVHLLPRHFISGEYVDKIDTEM